MSVQRAVTGAASTPGTVVTMSSEPAPVSSEPTTGPLVQSVDRAVTVLEILSRQPWSGVSEVARELGTHKSTVFRLLATLERRGLVEQDADTQKYRLGFGIVVLAGSARKQFDLTRLARPVCEELSESTDEIVTLGVLDGDHIVNIDHVNKSTSLVTVNWEGRRTELHTTANGKVLLAFMPGTQRDQILRGGLNATTPQTITDPDELSMHLKRVRENGYALTTEELEVGLHAVAAPIRDLEGDVVASISVSGPSYRMPADRLVEVALQAVEAANLVSQQLGWSGSRNG
jgi:DNA-binding IclR family transcriptional regulator